MLMMSLNLSASSNNIMTPKKRKQPQQSSSRQADPASSTALDKQSNGAITVCKRVPDPSAGVSGLATNQADKSLGATGKTDCSKKQGTHRKQISTDQNKAIANGQKDRLNSNNRRQKTNGSTKNTPPSGDGNPLCTTSDEFSKRAAELKTDIKSALEKQASIQHLDQSSEVSKLKEEIMRVAGLKLSDIEGEIEARVRETDEPNVIEHSDDQNDGTKAPASQPTKDVELKTGIDEDGEPDSAKIAINDITKSLEGNCITANKPPKLSENISVQTSDRQSMQKQGVVLSSRENVEFKVDHSQKSNNNNIVKETCNPTIDSFDTLDAKLDEDSKYIALISSLRKHFTNSPPEVLDAICKKMVRMSEQNSQLSINCENYQSENQKLLLVKQKLENLCRELQKSNNSIRIESLDLIKAEQGKAKEQTTKIQSTLSGVIKLFDENQQRNMSLRQENHELQQKLKSLLDHCDNWEKSVQAAFKQRDIESRLLKTELAKANLLKNEEKEKFLGEKQELLRVLSMMQEQQHRIEGQEAKLRSDLSSYASKYDECQAVISKGMSKFQTESKRMLQQIERSKQDYKMLLSKYETCTKRMTQLLEEKRSWDKSLKAANKKVETLEKLCRALSERKQKGCGNADDEAIKNQSVQTINSEPVLDGELGETSAVDNDCVNLEFESNILLLPGITEVNQQEEGSKSQAVRVTSQESEIN